MSTVTSFTHSVKEIENIWIPLSDGIRLATRVWMPEYVPSNPLPVMLEYLPYRKCDAHARATSPFEYYQNLRRQPACLIGTEPGQYVLQNFSVRDCTLIKTWVKLPDCLN